MVWTLLHRLLLRFARVDMLVSGALSGWVGCRLPVPRLGSVQLSTEVTPSGGMRDTAFPVSSRGHTSQTRRGIPRLPCRVSRAGWGV